MPTNSQIEHAIAENIHSERDRGILRRVKCDGITYEAVAEEYSVCRNTVYNVMRKHRNLFE